MCRSDGSRRSRMTGSRCGTFTSPTAEPDQHVAKGSEPTTPASPNCFPVGDFGATVFCTGSWRHECSGSSASRSRPSTTHRCELSGGVVTHTPIPRPGTSPAKLLAVLVGLVAAAALLQAPSAVASRQSSDNQLAAAKHAVNKSGVRGIAWYVDSAANRVVVTA